jgi:TonB-dependent starch-binding outer membrane protein SusC
MSKRRLWAFGAWVAVAALCAGGAGAQASPTGIVTGTVTDADSKAPIPDVVVRVVGTTRAARTDANGRYRLTGVPTGPERLQVNRLGYGVAGKPVVVSDAGSSVVDFSLVVASVTLNRVVTTSTSGTQEQARVNGASIGSISIDSVVAAPVTNFSELLNSRVAGVTVIQNSGEIGTGSRIVIRGEGTAALSNAPLIVIDGVRAYNNTNGFSTFGLGGQTISRFDDLDFENIETVEVLRGPAAAALYGTEAAAGVIIINTKKGEVDEKPKWHTYGELGRLYDYTKYPDVWGRPAAGGGQCSLIDEYEGFCVGANGPTAATPGFSFNLLKSEPLFVNGYDEGAGASVEGGSQAMTYYSGFDWKRQQGVFEDNSDRSTHANGGFNLHPVPILDIGLTALYTQRRIVVPLGDNAIGGNLTGGLLGSPEPGGWFGGLSPRVTEQIRNNENVDRFTIGASGTLRLLPWLTARGTAGMDYNGIFDFFRLPDGPASSLNTFPASAEDGAVYEYTGAASIAAHYPIPVTDALTGTTTFGGEWVDFSLHSIVGQGAGLIPGTNSVNGATAGFNAFETNQDIVNIGGYLQQQFAWRNVLFATVSGRLDGNSAFGANNSTAFYPAGSLSYVVSDEPYWPKQDYVSSFRVRLAGGQSGREPFFRLANGSFTGASYNLNGTGNNTGYIPFTIGNADLKPERSTEYEAGLDVGFWRDRFSVTATAFDRTERDLIQAVPVDISTGQPSITTNLGEIDNRGLEVTFSGRIIDTKAVAFDMSALLTVSRNKLVNLGIVGSSDVAFGGQGSVIQQLIGGQPLGVFTSIPYTYKDLNHDGVIEPNEITYGSKPVVVGEPGPRDELTLSPTITIFKYFRINAQFDRRDGVTVFDGGDEFQCLFDVGRECNDPHAPLKDQAAAVAASGAGENTDYGYLLNGSFWKVREVSLRIIAPDSWVHRFLGGHDGSLTLSGRNLATWTPYRGLDPEVNEFGGQPTLANAQFFTQPPLRAFIARIDLTW